MMLKNLAAHNYIPYSGQASTAVVQSREGAYFPGVRVENISFPLTISAIQNALFSCLSEGHQPGVIYADNTDDYHAEFQYWEEAYKLQLKTFDELAEITFDPVARQIDEANIQGTLKDLQQHAHVDFSHFPVSALLETKNGFYTGVNIELNDWSRGLCAERVALAKAISYGETNFHALHIYTQKGEYNSPCGACRQVIIEHLPHQSVFLHHADGTTAQHYSSHLLPYSFQSSTLKKDPN